MVKNSGKSQVLSDLVYSQIQTMAPGEIARFRRVLTANLPRFIEKSAELARAGRDVELIIISRIGDTTKEK